MDLFENPKVADLLHQANTAVKMMETADADSRREFRSALDTIYQDLGKLVHGIARTRKDIQLPDTLPDGLPQPEDLDDELQFTSELQPVGEVSQEWFTDEVDTSPALAAKPPAPAEQIEGTIEDTLDEPLSPGESPRYPDWLPQLVDLLDLLLTPEALADQVEWAVEATRIQWATSGMQKGWASYPQSVQVALLGLLASRARHLKENLAVTVGPILALDRLQRHQIDAQLPSVVGLHEDRGPEFDEWLEDARHWWNALHDGISAIEDATLQ